MSGVITQDVKKPVATLWTGRLIVLLTISLLLNGVLGVLHYLQKQDTAFWRESEHDTRKDNEILMALIPVVRPSVSRAELATELRSRYPGEDVNVGPKQVQWRLFHFWFDEQGRLVEVQWSS